MFVATGNGDYDATTPYAKGMDFGDTLLNLDLSGGHFTVTDEFTPYNQATLETNDLDLDSSGALILPNQPGIHPHVLVQGSKQGAYYLIDRESMGGYHTTDQVVQSILDGHCSTCNNSGIWGSPSYWNNRVFIGGNGAPLTTFAVTTQQLGNNTETAQLSQSTQTSGSFAFPGTIPTISSNGTTNGILWAVDYSAWETDGSAILEAFDATNPTTLFYSSNTNSSRDNPGTALKYATPTIANGKLYLGGTGPTRATGVLNVYGLLNGAQTTAAPTFNPGTELFQNSVSVSISDTTGGAVIYYTTDGSMPTTSSSMYSTPIIVTTTTTINAIAKAPSDLASGEASATYTLSSGGGGSVPNYPSGFTSTGMTLNGAVINGTTLELVDGGASETHSAYFTTQVDVTAFTNDFDFQFLKPLGGGFTFILQSEGVNAVGTPGGSALGSVGISPSVAIKFDIFNNAGEGTDSTGLYLNGASPTVPAVDISSSGIQLSSGDVLHAQMVYDGTNLTLTLTDASKSLTFTHVFPVNIPQVLGGNTAFVGFTSATGSSTSIDNILDWTYSTSGASAPATPVISPGSESFQTSVSVTITDSTQNSTIYYTTDGSNPTTSSTVYSGAIHVTATETIKAIASASGQQSNVATAVYTLSGGGGGSLPNYPAGTGFTSTGLTFNGGAVISGTDLEMTDGGANETRTVYFSTAVGVGTFTNDFDFQITKPVGGGFTFILQNAGLSAVGTPGGSGLGSHNIGTSVAIKFDIFSNAGEGNDSTGVYLDGASPTVPATDITPSGIELNSGDVLHAHMVYDGTNLTLTITDPGKSLTFTQAYPVNIPQVVGGNTAYVGFTAASGSSSAVQNILDWTYTTP